jgi:hypothetical protein
VLDPDRYPEGITFIASDQEGLSRSLAEAVADRRPVAIFYPDGREIVATPRGGALGLLARWASRCSEGRGQGGRSVRLPADYQVEIGEPLVA